ncbi:MAG: hypothetical protein KGO47_06165 [Cyanobacteria bacterium REEB417]|nr:hypothetical protein [Cyanobacteria bacterium REEB417]
MSRFCSPRASSGCSCRVLLVETEDAGRVSGWLRRQGGESVLELEIS